LRHSGPPGQTPTPHRRPGPVDRLASRWREPLQGVTKLGPRQIGARCACSIDGQKDQSQGALLPLLHALRVCGSRALPPLPHETVTVGMGKATSGRWRAGGDARAPARAVPPCRRSPGPPRAPERGLLWPALAAR